MNARFFLRSKSAVIVRIALCGALALLLALYAPITPAAHAQKTRGAAPVNPEMIRLHVLANSDTAEDQRIKLCVRDAIRDTAARLCAQAEDADGAYKALESAKELLLAAAQAEARAQGFSGGVSIEFGIFPFPDREYAGELVPAGEYRAVRVLVGEGEGQNWWCVLYPDLCFVDEACGEAAESYQITFYSSIARFFARWINRGETK